MRAGGARPDARRSHAARADALALRVPHVRQRRQWDCGLACVCMVLAARNAVSSSSSASASLPTACSLPALRRRVSTCSVWTIDLAFLLSALGVRDAVYYTLTLGASEAYASERFYRRRFDADAKRVNALFARALAHDADEGVHVRRESLSSEQLLQLLAGARGRRHAFVVLVDKRRLHCISANSSSSSGNEDGSAECARRERRRRPERAPISCCALAAAAASRDTGYLGHYVVVYGYDAARDAYLVRDPASARKTRLVRRAVMHEARTQFGTDEDVLAVPIA